jgi:hypothetical protein
MGSSASAVADVDRQHSHRAGVTPAYSGEQLDPVEASLAEIRDSDRDRTAVACEPGEQVESLRRALSR